MPGGAEGSPPLPPGAAPRARGGTVPRLPRQPPPRPAGGKGQPAGERVPAGSRSLITQKAQSTGWDNGAAGLLSDRGARGRQEEKPGRGDYSKRGSIPERPLPRENFLFLGCRDRGKAGWKFLREVPARLEGCPAGPASPVRCLRDHHRRRREGAQPSRLPPTFWALPAELRGIAGDARPLPTGAAPRRLFLLAFLLPSPRPSPLNPRQLPGC